MTGPTDALTAQRAWGPQLEKPPARDVSLADSPQDTKPDRLGRVFRIAKLARYSTALRTFGRVLSQKKEELIIASFLLALSAMFTSTLMYCAESDTLPRDERHQL